MLAQCRQQNLPAASAQLHSQEHEIVQAPLVYLFLPMMHATLTQSLHLILLATEG